MITAPVMTELKTTSFTESRIWKLSSKCGLQLQLLLTLLKFSSFAIVSRYCYLRVKPFHASVPLCLMPYRLKQSFEDVGVSF